MVDHFRDAHALSKIPQTQVNDVDVEAFYQAVSIMHVISPQNDFFLSAPAIFLKAFTHLKNGQLGGRVCTLNAPMRTPWVTRLRPVKN